MSPAEREGGDKEIIAAFLDNNPKAIGTVARWARAVAEHFAWGFETPEDIVQTTLLVLVRNFREGRFAGDELRAYVRRVAKNTCISSYRRARTRGVQVPVERESRSAPPLANPGMDPERLALLGRVLERLDQACRQIISMAYELGLSRKEIAARLGISEGATKVRLFRCLEKARGILQSAEGGA